jgi:hypothetical protein
MTLSWEYGSEFHWPDLSRWPRPVTAPPILPRDAQLFGSGRDALRAVLEWGKRERGWRRAWIPSYFCNDVTPVIESSMEKIAFYHDSPLDASPPAPSEANAGRDVVIVLNYFGLRGRNAGESIAAASADVIEDHSHDPWGPWVRASGADWCFASLRKTLPIPDGGALWSPAGLDVPAAGPATDVRKAASHQKLSAMALKTTYLSGGGIDKERFRTLQIEGEKSIAAGPISGATELVRELLRSLPWESWRAARRSNWEFLADSLRPEEGLRILEPYDAESCPFSLVLDLGDGEIRDRLRDLLIDESIYTAILWPLDAGPQNDLTRAAARLSRRLLSVPCDFRYSRDDLLRVARSIVTAFRSAKNR